MTAGPAPGRAADPARTVFFGSGTFAVPILDALAAVPRLSLVGVVTAPDRPAGRGRELASTPVARRATELGLPVLRPPRVRAPDAVAEIAALRPDLGVLADYGQIIPRDLLELPPLGILNVHPSLLPRHRGAAPIQATIAEGDPRTGVAIIRMDAGVDTGPIVATIGWPLLGTERAPDLEAFAAREGADLLVRTLAPWLGGEITATPQEEAGATVTRILRRDDARLDPTRSAAELERRVRAYAPWPGAFLETAAGRVAVHAASTAPSGEGDAPGRLVRHQDRLALAASDGRLVLDEVQLAGRRAARGDEFLRGRPRLVDSEVARPPAAAGDASAGSAPAPQPAGSRR
jgi:methionyl-tRNA formyltransferase